MPNNFMIIDVEKTVLAMLFCPLVFYMPGYVIGTVSNALHFNEENIGVKSMVALCFSIAMFPTAVFTLGMFAGLQLILWAYLALALAFCWFAGGDFLRAAKKNSISIILARSAKDCRFGLITALIWTAISVFSLVDWQTEPGLLFPPVEVHDYTKHIVVTDAITRTGVPPVSPMFAPPNPPKLFYYYYWFMLCSLVQRSAFGLLSARECVLAADVFTGFAFLAAIALAAKHLLPQSEENSWQTAKIACACTLVTGLDILPVGLSHLLQAARHELPLFASVEWWNDYIENFTHFALWVPHHIAGFVSCLIGSILLRRYQETGEKPIWTSALVSMAFASAIGLSIYISLTFAFGWCLWILVCLRTKISDRLSTVACVGLLTAFSAAPLIFVLMQANHSNAQQIALTIRPFIFGEALLNHFLPPAWINQWTMALEHLAFLPLNYAMEFGFFALGAIIYWRTRKERSQRDWFVLTLFAASLTIATFFRSAIRNNDLGIRGVSIAQLSMLLWSARLLHEQFAGHLVTPLRQVQKNLLYASLFVGFSGVVYDLYVLRSADQLGMRRAYDAGVENGERNYGARELYAQVDNFLVPDAIIQHNPVHTLEPYDGCYGTRQAVLFDRHYGTLMGISQEIYAPVEDDIAKMFSSDTFDQVKATADKYKIDALVVKDDDPIWQDKSSWLSQAHPDWENKTARLYILNSAKRRH